MSTVLNLLGVEFTEDIYKRIRFIEDLYKEAYSKEIPKNGT